MNAKTLGDFEGIQQNAAGAISAMRLVRATRGGLLFTMARKF